MSLRQSSLIPNTVKVLLVQVADSFGEIKILVGCVSLTTEHLVSSYCEHFELSAAPESALLARGYLAFINFHLGFSYPANGCIVLMYSHDQGLKIINFQIASSVTNSKTE